MKKLLLLGAAALLSLPMTAQAGTISIGLQQAGVNGGAITTVATGSGTATLASLAYGSFIVNQANAQDQAVLSGTGLLNSNALNISFTSGTLNVFVTSTGLTKDLGQVGFDSSFDVNNLNFGISSVTTSSFYDASNTAYALTTPLGTHAFTSPGGTPDQIALLSVGGTYSLTEEYHIVATGSGNDNVTIDVSSVIAAPEPASLALLGVGLLGIGFVAKRKRSV